MIEPVVIGKATLYCGDCLEVMCAMPDNSVDSIVTDPPYGLSFMGKHWDYDVPSVEIWREALRILKPGGYLLAFAGTRTQHRMAVNIEDAGFEIRDMIAWCYGSGFPKSLDVSKAIDKMAGAEREVVGRYQPPGMDKPWNLQNAKDERTVPLSASTRNNLDITAPATDAAKQWDGWGTALKPALEPITMARKPFNTTVAENVLQHGTGAINVDGCRVSTEEVLRAGSGGIPCRHDDAVPRQPSTPVEQNSLGRWPANLIHDGSDEVLALFPDSTSGAMKAGTQRAAQDEPGSVCYGTYGGNATSVEIESSSGSAARFFYCPKASREDRNEGLEGMPERISGMVSNTSGQHITRRDGDAPGPRANHHPTVKPTDLMRYLQRLVTQPGGITLDCFMGSGSSGKAAILEGFRFIGIERDEAYIDIAKARIEHAIQQFEQATKQQRLFA